MERDRGGSATRDDPRWPVALPDGPATFRIVAYHGNRYADAFALHLDEIRAHGFSCVLHCVTEQDLAWGGDAVRRLVRSTRDAGLDAWADPWGLGGVFDGEAHSGFRAAGGVGCARDHGFVALVERWAGLVADAGATSAFWDNPQGQAGASCRCCGPLDLLARCCEIGRAAGLRNVCCLPAIEHWDAPERYRALAASPLVDEIATDPYDLGQRFYDAGWVEATCRMLREAAEAAAKPCHAWVQGFGLGPGREGVPAQQAAAMRRAGLSRLGFWSFRACEASPAIAPADPAAVWAGARLL